METHREVNVRRWDELLNENEELSKATYDRYVRSIIEAREAVLAGIKASDDYDFELLTKIVFSKTLNDNLYEACDFFMIKGSEFNLSREERDTVGFNWGSCAWKSNACGAQADAQEALAEIKAFVGLLEPFENNFCLGIALRSFDEILAVVRK